MNNTTFTSFTEILTSLYNAIGEKPSKQQRSSSMIILPICRKNLNAINSIGLIMKP